MGISLKDALLKVKKKVPEASINIRQATPYEDGYVVEFDFGGDKTNFGNVQVCFVNDDGVENISPLELFIDKRWSGLSSNM